jgi:hypothetical protein
VWAFLMAVIHVEDVSGNSLAGVVVTIYLYADPSTVIFSDVTDNAGDVTVFYLEPDFYIVTANYPTYNQSLEIWDGQSDLLIYMEQPSPPQPVGTITAIRVHDVSRNIWYNWDKDYPQAGFPAWYIILSDGSRVLANPAVLPGANNLYIAFYVRNDGIAGAITAKLTTNTSQVLASATQTLSYGAGFGLEWTGDAPLIQVLVFEAVAEP